MNRRIFLAILGSVTMGASSMRGEDGSEQQYDTIDAGPLDQFELDKVYDQHRETGFFIIRRAGEVFALSSICTHKGCKVRSQTDQSFLCKCHSSRFDPSGKVLNGPAIYDLPRLKVKTSSNQNLLVRMPRR